MTPEGLIRTAWNIWYNPTYSEITLVWEWTDQDSWKSDRFIVNLSINNVNTSVTTTQDQAEVISWESIIYVDPISVFWATASNWGSLNFSIDNSSADDFTAEKVTKDWKQVIKITNNKAWEALQPLRDDTISVELQNSSDPSQVKQVSLKIVQQNYAPEKLSSCSLALWEIVNEWESISAGQDLKNLNICYTDKNWDTITFSPQSWFDNVLQMVWWIIEWSWVNAPSEWAQTFSFSVSDWENSVSQSWSYNVWALNEDMTAPSSIDLYLWKDWWSKNLGIDNDNIAYTTSIETNPSDKWKSYIDRIENGIIYFNAAPVWDDVELDFYVRATDNELSSDFERIHITWTLSWETPNITNPLPNNINEWTQVETVILTLENNARISSLNSVNIITENGLVTHPWSEITSVNILRDGNWISTWEIEVQFKPWNPVSSNWQIWISVNVNLENWNSWEANTGLVDLVTDTVNEDITVTTSSFTGYQNKEWGNLDPWVTNSWGQNPTASKSSWGNMDRVSIDPTTWIISYESAAPGEEYTVSWTVTYTDPEVPTDTETVNLNFIVSNVAPSATVSSTNGNPPEGSQVTLSFNFNQDITNSLSQSSFDINNWQYVSHSINWDTVDLVVNVDTFTNYNPFTAILTAGIKTWEVTIQNWNSNQSPITSWEYYIQEVN